MKEREIAARLADQRSMAAYNAKSTDPSDYSFMRELDPERTGLREIGVEAWADYLIAPEKITYPALRGGASRFAISDGWQRELVFTDKLLDMHKHACSRIGSHKQSQLRARVLGRVIEALMCELYDSYALSDLVHIPATEIWQEEDIIERIACACDEEPRKAEFHDNLDGLPGRASRAAMTLSQRAAIMMHRLGVPQQGKPGSLTAQVYARHAARCSKSKADALVMSPDGLIVVDLKCRKAFVSCQHPYDDWNPKMSAQLFLYALLMNCSDDPEFPVPRFVSTLNPVLGSIEKQPIALSAQKHERLLREYARLIRLDAKWADIAITRMKNGGKLV